jgi:hypothetical protein
MLSTTANPKEGLRLKGSMNMPPSDHPFPAFFVRFGASAKV